MTSAALKAWDVFEGQQQLHYLEEDARYYEQCAEVAAAKAQSARHRHNGEYTRLVALYGRDVVEG